MTGKDNTDVKIAKIEVTVDFCKAELSEMKQDIKDLKNAISQNSGVVTYLKGSWHSIALLLLIAWNIFKLFVKTHFGTP